MFYAIFKKLSSSSEGCFLTWWSKSKCLLTFKPRFPTIINQTMLWNVSFQSIYFSFEKEIINIPVKPPKEINMCIQRLCPSFTQDAITKDPFIYFLIFSIIVILFLCFCLMSSEHLPEPTKAVDHLKKLTAVLEEDHKVRAAMEKVVDPKVTCKRALQSVVSITHEWSVWVAPKVGSLFMVNCKWFLFHRAAKHKSMLSFRPKN